MAKHKDVDHLFKEGLENYSEKPSKDLEAKMAAMIGVSAIAAATGTAAAGTTVAASTASAGTATVAGLAEGGLIAKAGAVVKLASIKGAVILKSLGIIKTVATLAVIGTATTATVLVSEEIKENKSIEKIEQTKQTNQKQLCNTIHSKTTYLHIEEQIPSLASRDMQTAPWTYLDEIAEESDERPAYLASIDMMGIELEESPSAMESKNEMKSPLDKKDTNHAEETLLDQKTQTTRTADSNADTPPDILEYTSEEEEQAESIPLRPLNPIITKEVDSNMFIVEELILQAPPMAAPTMSTLEKGFYLPNYIIQADFSLMPMMYSNLIKPKDFNDTITESQVIQNPQFSYQIGAAMRIQKKRSPWFLQAGINYQHLKEKVDLYFKREYIDHDQSYWNMDTVYNYIINPPVIDSSIQSIDSTLMDYWIQSEDRKASVNSYQFLEIPLRIGYQYHDYGKKWSVEASTGLSFALHLKSTGYTYNNSGYIINYKEAKQRPQVYCYYVAHVAFNYHLDRFTLFAEPSLKYQINKKTIDQSPYESRYLIYGLRMGIRIQLFKNGGQP